MNQIVTENEGVLSVPNVSVTGSVSTQKVVSPAIVSADGTVSVGGESARFSMNSSDGTLAYLSGPSADPDEFVKKSDLPEGIAVVPEGLDALEDRVEVLENAGYVTADGLSGLGVLTSDDLVDGGAVESAGFLKRDSLYTMDTNDQEVPIYATVDAMTAALEEYSSKAGSVLEMAEAAVRGMSGIVEDYESLEGGLESLASKGDLSSAVSDVTGMFGGYVTREEFDSLAQYVSDLDSNDDPSGGSEDSNDFQLWLDGLSMAAGRDALALGTGSVAIGAGAVATVSEAVQLGAGSNDEPATLKFRDFELLDADGKIPAERIPDVSSLANVYTRDEANGLFLKYNSQSHKMSIGGSDVANLSVGIDGIGTLVSEGVSDALSGMMLGDVKANPNATQIDDLGGVAVAIGRGAIAMGAESVALGYMAEADGFRSIAIGNGEPNTSPNTMTVWGHEVFKLVGGSVELSDALMSSIAGNSLTLDAAKDLFVMKESAFGRKRKEEFSDIDQESVTLLPDIATVLYLRHNQRNELVVNLVLSDNGTEDRFMNDTSLLVYAVRTDDNAAAVSPLASESFGIRVSPGLLDGTGGFVPFVAGGPTPIVLASDENVLNNVAYGVWTLFTFTDVARMDRAEYGENSPPPGYENSVVIVVTRRELTRVESFLPSAQQS